MSMHSLYKARTLWPPVHAAPTAQCKKECGKIPIGIDVRVVVHLTPFRGFRGDELAEIRRRAAVYHGADIGRALIKFVVGERVADPLFVRNDDRASAR
jgi:hypothetical protein